MVMCGRVATGQFRERDWGMSEEAAHTSRATRVSKAAACLPRARAHVMPRQRGAQIGSYRKNALQQQAHGGRNEKETGGGGASRGADGGRGAAARAWMRLCEVENVPEGATTPVQPQGGGEGACRSQAQVNQGAGATNAWGDEVWGHEPTVPGRETDEGGCSQRCGR